MVKNKERRLCTVDHAAKQLDAIGWSDHRYWLDFARRRLAAREARRRRGEPERRQGGPERQSSPGDPAA